MVGVEPQVPIVVKICVISSVQVGVEPQKDIVILHTVKANVQDLIHRDVVDGKLVGGNVLLDYVVVSLVGVEPLQSIVLVKNVKVSEKGHHHPRLHHPHPHHSHRDDAESKLLVEHVLLECAVVYGAGVEPHVTIVVLPTVKVSARAV
ncbi:hypothetical protein FXO38_29099 [Capsicum annuum]|nr:hypothetical protein FXO38_29099 [Capsicum annuum]